MPRRSPYTSLEKEGQNRPDYVKGMSDVTFKVFQCLAGACQQMLTVPEDEIGPEFQMACPSCGFTHASGDETRFFDYRLVHKDGSVIETGEFVILHDDYIAQAPRFKYCVICYTLKPLDSFDRHSARRSGRQGECRLCKTLYNGIKNQSRITDQHREAAQRRRLYRRLAGQAGRIDSKAIFDKFGGTCFNCGRSLTYTSSGQRDFNLDHTLPARLLWPLTTEAGTLLCNGCNNEKHDKWPSEFYDDHKLRELAVKTGYTYELLTGKPIVNEDALAEILKDPDGFLEEWIHYPADIRKVRSMIRNIADVDIFEEASNVPEYLRDAEELDSDPTD